MYKHVFLSQCVNCKIFPVAFHCDSTREKFDKTNKNSQMNNSKHCAERCSISKVWGSLILEPEAWTVFHSCIQDHSLQEVSQLSLCSRQRRENLHSFHRGAFLVLLHLSAFYPFLRADLKSHCPLEFLTYDASGWLSFSSYTFYVFGVHHVMGILSHSALYNKCLLFTRSHFCNFSQPNPGV